MSNNFPKSQRLCSHYLIDRLFTPGNSRSHSAYPLRLVYRIEDSQPHCADTDFPAQLLISVPKRCFKHAVDRNKVKRQVREAYRTNRSLLVMPEGKHAYLAIIWLDNKHYPSSVVTAKVTNLLQRASEAMSERHEAI